MSRRLKLGLVVLAVLAVVGGLLAWALPEVVRRVVVAQMPAVLGRRVSIEDVDLNLVTGRFAVKKLRVAEREGPDAFVDLDRLEGRIWLFSLPALDVRLSELRLVRPVVRVIRTGPSEFNFSDIVALLTKVDPAKKPSRWTYTLDRVSLASGQVLVEDRAVVPPADWSLRDLEIDGAGISTRADRPPGRIGLRADARGTRVEIALDALKLGPVVAEARVGLTKFDLARLRPYLPADAPVFAERGVLTVALAGGWKREPGKIDTAYGSGNVDLEGLALSQPGRSAPFVAVPRIALAVKRADFIGRDIAIGSIEIDGLDAQAVRDASGRIDVLAAMDKRAPADGPKVDPTPAPAPGEPAPAANEWKIRLERLTVRKAVLGLADDGVTPRRTWRADGIEIEGGGLSTVATDAAGSVKIAAQIGVSPGPATPASFGVAADSIRLMPWAVSARLTLSGFDVTSANPYVPEGVAAAPSSGVLDVRLDAQAEQGPSGPSRATVAGQVDLRDLRVVRRGTTAPFLSTKGLTVDIRQADLVAREIALGRIDVRGLDAKASRSRDGRIDLAELASGPSPARGAEAKAAPGGAEAKAAPTPTAGGAPWRLVVDRLALRDSRVAFDDQGVAPARQWTLGGLWVNGARLSTRPKDPPGELRLRANLIAGDGQGAPAKLRTDVTGLRLAPIALKAQVGLEGFDVTSVAPYVPETAAARPARGRLDADISAVLEAVSAGLTKATLSGTARLGDVAVVQRGHAEPFFSAPAVSVAIKEADAIGRKVTVGEFTVDGMQARIVRDANGDIDLQALAAATPDKAVEALTEAVSVPAAPVPGTAQPAPAAPPPPPSDWDVGIERFAVKRGTVVFDDQGVSPATSLSLTDVTVDAERLGWPATRPATLSVSVGMPGGGRTEIKGTMVLQPLNTQITIKTFDAPVEPYQVYFPFAAELHGLFSGDSLNEIQRGPAGELILASRGSASARDLEVREMGRAEPVARMASMEIKGIDFSWPNYALIEKATLRRPAIEVERDQAGVMNLTRLFKARPAGEGGDGKGAPATPAETAKEPPPAPAAQPAKDAAPAAEGEKEKTGGPTLRDIVIDVTEFSIEDGYARFIDRTTAPPFSESLSRLAVTIRDLSTELGRRRTTLVAQAVVGSDATLDLRGELSGLGETLRADLVGDLKGFDLSSANPYSDQMTSWVVQSGTATARVHYRIEGDRVSAEHDVDFKGLKVERAPESAQQKKNRLGVPLGLAVSLLKDSRGDIDFSVPLHGTLSDRSFDWGEAMWSGIKQVLVKVLAAPFSAIGRVFTGGGDQTPTKFEIDPVTFAPGSSVIVPDMERQITRIADFLRRSPYVRLRVSTVATEADVQSLKTLAVTRRLDRFRTDNGLADAASTLRAYYQRHATNLTLPKTTEEQVALLVEREPAPAEALAELGRRRLDATRERLSKAEGIPAERLEVPDAVPASDAAATGNGRVEFTIVAEAG